MKKGYVRIILIVFLLLDTIFSFVQHYQKSLDGDIATIVLGYPEVMHDPFGMKVLLHHEVYGGTNRFFAHWNMSIYFKNIPMIIQQFSNPIESIYLSCALAKTLIQLAIIFILAFLITGEKKPGHFNFLLGTSLITALFQTNGYGGYMGIINSSITYTFFYSFWIAMQLIFICLLRKFILKNSWNDLSKMRILTLILFSIIVALGGPLNAALTLIGLLVLFLIELQRTADGISKWSIQKITVRFYILMISASVASLYSIYLGQYNAENFFHNISIPERYAVLPKGLLNLFTQKLGLPLLLFTIILNLIVIGKMKNSASAFIISQAKWLGLFALIYILILPLGGYREYRPNIIRSDTFIPVVICMIYLFGVTTFALINNIRRFRSLYITFIIIFTLVFTIADSSIKQENSCEKNALNTIAKSPEKIVVLDNDCNVMSWYKITDPNNSRLNGTLLKMWNVTDEEKLYYQN